MLWRVGGEFGNAISVGGRGGPFSVYLSTLSLGGDARIE